MTELNQIYKCEMCGNITEVIHTGVGNLVCCGQPMKLLEEKNQEEGGSQQEDKPHAEKHVPVVKNLKTKVRVRVGSKEHPMLEEHFIEFIELIVDGKVYRKYLKPGDKPFAEFCVLGENISARCYCNVHGLWKS